MSKSPWADLVAATLRNHSGTLADNLNRNNTVLQRLTHAHEWRETWRKATANMPWKEGNRETEQRITLAKCLGVPTYHVDRGHVEGHEPKKAKHRALVCQLAGHYGTQLAAIRLANLGVIDQYPHWPDQAS